MKCLVSKPVACSTSDAIHGSVLTCAFYPLGKHGIGRFYFPDSLFTSCSLVKIKQQQGRPAWGREDSLRAMTVLLIHFINMHLPRGDHGCLQRQFRLSLRPQVRAPIPPSSPAPTLPLTWLQPCPSGDHSQPPVYLSKVGRCLAICPPR